MRIQARLFLGTALLVLALMATQWWLHQRQLKAVQEQFGVVATSVGEDLLSGKHRFVFQSEITMDGETDQDDTLVWLDSDREIMATQSDGATVLGKNKVRVIVNQTGEIITHDVSGPSGGKNKAIATSLGDAATATVDAYAVTIGDGQATTLPVSINRDDLIEKALAVLPEKAQHIKVEFIEGGGAHEAMLVVHAEGGAQSVIPVPVSEAVQEISTSQQQGMGITALLLGVGLIASAVIARRVAKPLQDLAVGAEALGAGKFGTQVETNASGEVGELQRAFNRMSSRLAELEEEKNQWRKREHLAQLGDLSRGLAHTVRNPLNTLGLAVEELADTEQEKQAIVVTAREQIARIDRWLRSFLALGAGDAARQEICDLNTLVESVVFESVQHGAQVNLDLHEDHLPVKIVETAVASAIANLVQNGVEASPPEAAVELSLDRDGDDAIIRIVDAGPGLPPEVRERLFSPHMTTKVGGSGMGLFLARQLIVEMHGGTLDIAGRNEGGTIVTVRLPLFRNGDEA